MGAYRRNYRYALLEIFFYNLRSGICMSMVVGLLSRLSRMSCDRNQSYQTADEPTPNPFPEEPLPNTDAIPETHTAM